MSVSVTKMWILTSSWKFFGENFSKCSEHKKHYRGIKLYKGVGVCVIVANLSEFEIHSSKKNFHLVLKGKLAKHQEEYVNVDMLTIHCKCKVSIPFLTFNNALWHSASFYEVTAICSMNDIFYRIENSCSADLRKMSQIESLSI